MPRYPLDPPPLRGAQGRYLLGQVLTQDVSTPRHLAIRVAVVGAVYDTTVAAAPTFAAQLPSLATDLILSPPSPPSPPLVQSVQSDDDCWRVYVIGGEVVTSRYFYRKAVLSTLDQLGKTKTHTHTHTRKPAKDMAHKTILQKKLY
jgi:hypothetical protein